MNELGDVRVRDFIHPDSIGVKVWEVEQLSLANGKYAKPGQTCWRNVTGQIEPFTSQAEVIDFLVNFYNSN